MKRMLRLGMVVVAGLSMAAANACGSPGWWDMLGLGSDLHAYLDDARGLKPGAAVVWRGIDVGMVTTVRAEDGRIRVGVDLKRDYRKELPGGIKAWPSLNVLTRETTLRLVGGALEGADAPARGDEIPAAAWYEAVTKQQLLVAGGGFVAVLLVLLILKGIKKLLFVVCMGAVIFAGAVWVRQQMAGTDGGGGQAVEVDRLIEQLRGTPEGGAVADRLQEALKTAMERVREGGPETCARVRGDVERLFRAERARLSDKGRAGDAETVSRLEALFRDVLPRGDGDAGETRGE